MFSYYEFIRDSFPFSHYGAYIKNSELTVDITVSKFKSDAAHSLSLYSVKPLMITPKSKQPPEPYPAIETAKYKESDTLFMKPDC